MLETKHGQISYWPFQADFLRQGQGQLSFITLLHLGRRKTGCGISLGVTQPPKQNSCFSVEEPPRQELVDRFLVSNLPIIN